MAQNNQDGSTTAAPQDAGLQLQITGLDQFKDLKFIQSEVNPADLVVQFPDGSEVVFPNYIPLAQAGAPPVMTLEDGTVIPGVEIVGLIENLDYDKIATAAGDPGAGGQGGAGGGAGFTADPSGLLGDDIGHGPYAGGIDLDSQGFTQVIAEPDPGSDDLPFEVVDDHVIHNLQDDGNPLDNPVDIPDVALRHNDIYPRGNWDLTSVDNEGPESPPQSNFELETAVNTTPADGILGSTEFNGSNTTARFTGTTTIVDPDGSDTGIVGIANNDGDSYSELSQAHETTQVGQVERMDWDLGRFILQTEAPGGRSADWDGTRIYLYEGETITMAPHSADLMDLDGGYIPTVAAIPADGAPPEYSYWMGIDPDPALDTDTDPGLGDPLFFYRPDGAKFDWEVLGLSQNGSISYEVPDGGTGWYYLGIGNISGDVTPEGLYRTEVEIDGVPYGEFDYTATDYVLSDGAHVTVDAIDERYYDNGEKKWVDIDTLNGTSGDDIIISGDSGDTLLGNDGMDVLIGRGGDDHLTGGDGSDLFLFEHAETTATTPTDGHDTIYNFSATDGDIINLDALFDELGVLSADREGNLLADNSSGVDTVLTVEDAGGTVVSGFSITLDGSDFDNADIAQLITDGNLVVDQS